MKCDYTCTMLNNISERKRVIVFYSSTGGIENNNSKIATDGGSCNFADYIKRKHISLNLTVTNKVY